MSRSVMTLLAWAGLIAAPTVGLAEPPAPQSPGVIVHTVAPGDTLALLAAELYGDRRHSVFIASENQTNQTQPFQPGTQLRIPIDREVVTAVGDTLGSLAEQYLGDARRAKFLAGFNDHLPPGLPASAPLSAGLVIRVPFHVQHTVARRETLAAIAALYFGTPERAKLIREYNFLATASPAPGQILHVPIYHVTVRSTRRPQLDAKSQERVIRRSEMQQRAHTALASARMAWAGGDYLAARRALEELDLDYLDGALAVEAGVLLGSAHVAFGDDALAVAAFQKVLQRKPSHLLDPYLVSPKIRIVWQRAGGAVSEAK